MSLAMIGALVSPCFFLCGNMALQGFLIQQWSVKLLMKIWRKLKCVRKTWPGHQLFTNLPPALQAYLRDISIVFCMRLTDTHRLYLGRRQWH